MTPVLCCRLNGTDVLKGVELTGAAFDDSMQFDDDFDEAKFWTDEDEDIASEFRLTVEDGFLIVPVSDVFFCFSFESSLNFFKKSSN